MDTCGQEKFRVMTSSYFGGANAVIIVFDVAKKDSFASVPKWISEAKRFSEKYDINLYFFSFVWYLYIVSTTYPIHSHSLLVQGEWYSSP